MRAGTKFFGYKTLRSLYSRPMNIDVEPLRKWFIAEKRAFPWRCNPSPYEVWISEVMLQQTQSARVVHFFEKWMKRFPTIEILALAEEEEVLKYWEGLGYYSRAKTLLQAARLLVKDFAGKLPKEIHHLEKIKGLGPYTIGAIRAFGFHEKASAVDGNVVRVIARLFEIEEDVSRLSTLKRIRLEAEKLLPEQESWVISEALIELGALICKPKAPLCESCPLSSQCKSAGNGTEGKIPVKEKKVKYETLFRDVAVIFYESEVLLQQGGSGKVMAGLYEFPYFSSEKGGATSESIRKKLESEFSIRATMNRELQEVKHSFTRYRVTLYPKVFTVSRKTTIPGLTWHPLTSREKLAFSSGHKRIVDCL